MSDRARQPFSAAEPPVFSDNVVVLLVDDQIMVGEAVRRALSDEPNIVFHYCARPAEAVAVAKEVKPTVILQDLVMPGIDGLELVRRYRQDPATVRIPIIVLSTKDEPAVKSAAFAAGANDYLVKLPDNIELVARLRYHSDAYVSRVQRDAADCALRESQRALIEANLELQRLTRVDGLTGLANRRYFDEFFTAEWKRAVRTQTPLSVLMIDIDCFKRYNDTYGHLAGDQVLRQVAETIQRNCGRSTDLGARYGGEEFIMVLCNTPITGIRAVGETLRQDIADLKLRHMASVVADHVTVSIGGASIIPRLSQSEALLIDAADRALYRAKDGGRNRLVVDGDPMAVVR
ncbi:MAG TPA: diguanylate cyclase [Acetobacteraceae bacterium]|jgi:two-component system chemotaxis family response regulator WspR|nr:diguanylate cyclase [Acetobacteraceae bacterium]